MKILRLLQNSPEWDEYRKGKIGGSKLGKLYSRIMPSKQLILGFAESRGYEVNPKSKIEDIVSQFTWHEIGELKSLQPDKDEFYRILAERVARPITLNDYDMPEGVAPSMMNRGHLLEPEAIALFEKTTGKKVDTQDIVWESDFNQSVYVSPDGSIEKDGKYTEAVEVKCPDTHVILRAWHEGKYPDEYREQVRQYFIVNDDLEKLYFVLYTDVMPALPIVIFEVTREEVKDDIEEFTAFETEKVKQLEALVERLTF